VVLGALSPRTRNAQVELYQNGDVDFLVATDAIGMGINMDVDHVAFAAMEKFDGVGIRQLRPEEIGQIAGRAGRHMNDGTFGVTAEAEPLDEELVSRVEGHRYDPVRVLQWRNAALNFHSLDALIASLDELPPAKGLMKARPSSDLIALRHLSQMDDVRELTRGTAGVRRLWDVCQLPDFRKLSADEPARLVHTIFLFLMGDDGTLPDDWLGRQIERLNITEGDVATLSGRLAQIRTWTYASHRPGWTRDNDHWQGVTRAVEDRLSDALHEQLTQRFIDRRTSVLMKRMREDDILDLKLDDSGGVIIGGEAVGKLEGFRFAPDPRAEGVHGKTLRAAALKGLEGEFHARANRLIAADDKALTLSEHGRIWWDGAIVAQLVAGASPFAPDVTLIADENLKPELRDGVQQRLETWITTRIAERLAPLLALRAAADAKAGTKGALPGFARAIAHQLAENFGSLDRAVIVMPENIGNLIRELKSFGVWVGKRTLYLPKLLRPEPASLLGLLWGVHQKLEHIPAPPLPGLTSFEHDGVAPYAFLEACGFRVVAGRPIRFDMLERLEDELEKGAASGAATDALLPKLVSLLGCGNDKLKEILSTLGWTTVEVADAGTVWRRTPVRSRKQDRERAKKEPPPSRKTKPSATALNELAARFAKR
jgi:ATP-dependent RNA helicase SUPV3L1/SUV3